jgi:hypothetical protein
LAGKWPRWNCIGRVNDPAEMVLAGSMTPLKFRMKFFNFVTIS